MASGKGTGINVAFIVGGFVITWSGIKNQTLKSTLTSLLKGQNPAASPESAPVAGIGTGSGPDSTGTTGTGSAPSVSGSYSAAQLEQLWTSSGGSSSKASVAACIAMHESSGDPKATSSNPDGGTNVGLWQLDTRGVGAGFSVAQLQNPQTNAQLAIMGSANGTNWADWSTAPDCGV
jgi:hypothetical protein